MKRLVRQLSMSASSDTLADYASPMMDNPLTVEDTQQIHSDAHEVLNKFKELYVPHYRNAVIAHLDEELKGATHATFLLDHRPASGSTHEIIRSGWITKQSGSFRQWRRRWLVVRADYMVEYYDRPSSRHPKGFMSLKGYRVDHSPIKDRPLGFALIPSTSTMRTWYISADTAEERDQWLEAFEEICGKAHGYKNADALVASEFAKAYRELLAAYGMRVVDSDIVEHEALAFVVVERLRTTVLARLHVELSDEKALVVDAYVEQIALLSAHDMWSEISDKCQRDRDELEEVIMTNKELFINTVGSIENLFREVFIEPQVRPLLDSIIAPFVTRSASILYAQLVESHVALFAIVHDAIKDALLVERDRAHEFARIEQDVSFRDALLNWPSRRLSEWHDTMHKVLEVVGSLEGACNPTFLAELRARAATDVRSSIVSVYPDFLEQSLYTLGRECIYSASLLILRGDNPDRATKDALYRLYHDMRIVVGTDVTRVYKKLLGPKYVSMFHQDAATLAEHVGPLPDTLKSVIDLEFVYRALIDHALDSTLERAVGQGLEAELVRIDEEAARFGVAEPPPPCAIEITPTRHPHSMSPSPSPRSAGPSPSPRSSGPSPLPGISGINRSQSASPAPPAFESIRRTVSPGPFLDPTKSPRLTNFL